MKVLQINSVCGIRSTGRIATDIAENFVSEGNICKIAYGRATAPDNYKNLSYRIGNDIHVIMNVLQARLLDNEGFNAKRSTAAFLKWAEEYDPDLLWLHNLHGYYINVEMLFNWIKQRPQMEVKWTLHDCWAFTGHCAHFSYARCDQWEKQCTKCPQKKCYPAGFLMDNCKDSFKRKKEAFCGVRNMTIITPSEWLAKLVSRSFLSEYPIAVVHNTIDTNVFKPTESGFREEYGLENKVVVLGVASAWGQRKGLNDFLKLSEILDDRFAVVIVGVTERQKKRLPKRVIAIEKTNSARELAQIYTAADVFLNLTYEDTYPTVNLEAQACGTPVITYRTGGSVESVPGENIAEQGDICGVAKLIERLV